MGILIILVLVCVGAGALIRPLITIIHQTLRDSVEKRKNQRVVISTIAENANVVKDRIATCEHNIEAITAMLDNLNARITNIEKKIGQAEVDSYGHLLENPTVVPKTELRKIEKEEKDNGHDSWKVL